MRKLYYIFLLFQASFQQHKLILISEKDLEPLKKQTGALKNYFKAYSLDKTS